MKKAITFLTASAMVLSLTSCGIIKEQKEQKEQKKKGATLEVSLDYAYIAEPINYKTDNIIPYMMLGNGVLFSQNSTNYLKRGNRFIYWDAATDTYTEMELHNADKKHGTPDVVKLPEGRFGLIFRRDAPNVKEWDLDADAYMDIYDSELNYLETRNIPELDGSPDGTFYFYAMEQDGKEYLAYQCADNGTMNLFICNMETMTHIGVISDTHQEFVSGASGELIGYFGKDAPLVRVNPEQCRLDTIEITYPETLGINSYGRIAAGSGEYDAYVYDMWNGTDLYGIRIDGNTGTCEKVMDFSDSDLVNNVTVYPAPDGTFFVYELSYPTHAFWHMRKRTEEEIENCQVISLAGVNLNGTLENVIVEYNRKHTDYHINMVDYIDMVSPLEDSGSKYEQSYERDALDMQQEAVQKFQNDLLDGIVPDIICTDNIPFQMLAGKGLFQDMTKLMEADENFHEEDYVMSFFDAMKFRGEQQTIAFSFNISTMVGETALVGDKQGLTPEEYMHLLDSTPEGMNPLDTYLQETYIDSFLPWMQNSFVDTENSTCSFDSPAFAKLIELSTTMPSRDEAVRNNIDTDAVSKLLTVASFRIPINYHELYVGEFDREDITLIGYPSMDGGNGGIFTAPYTVGINAMSNYQEEIWSIFMSMLSEEVQKKLDVTQSTYSFPVLRSALEEDLDAAMKGDSRTYTKYIFTEDQVIDQLITIGACSAEERALLADYIDHITAFYYTDQTISTIIREEAEMYIAGDQTAQEAANMIQSRASLYLSEQY